MILEKLFKKKDPKSIAQRIVKTISQSGFRYWRDEKFRDLTNFESISQKEHDRIFNELIVTGICQALFILDDIANHSDITLDSQEHLLSIRKKIPQQYLSTLRGLGVEEEFILLWEKLIDLREEEYLNNLPQAKEQTLYAKEFRNTSSQLKAAWAHIETLAIGSLHHIRKGKTIPKDPLWRSLRKWLIGLEKKLRGLI